MAQQRKAKSKQRPQPAVPARKEVPSATVPRRLLGVTGAADAAHPKWRLCLLDLEHAGNWSWGRATAETLHNISAFLSQMERLTWTEIRAMTHNRKSGPGHRNHKPIPVEQLCAEAQRRLVALELDDVDELFEFRLGNYPRLWGVIDDEHGVFYPVWWDPDHRVYPVDN